MDTYLHMAGYIRICIYINQHTDIDTHRGVKFLIVISNKNKNYNKKDLKIASC